jgi:hypothetical protein
MGYNDDTTTHHRLPRHLGSDDSTAQVKDRSFTVEYHADVELKCTVDGFKSALLGKYTLTDGPPTGKKTVLTNDYKATISLCDWVNQDHSDHWLNGDWIICDKMGLIHFWAPASTNNTLFPPTTGWNYAVYQDDERAFEGWDGKTNAPTKCQIVSKAYDTKLWCDKMYGKHPYCETRAKAITQLPKDSKVRQQNKLYAEYLELEGDEDTDLPEPDESSSSEEMFFKEECSYCDGEGKVSKSMFGVSYMGNCKDCDGKGYYYW